MAEDHEINEAVEILKAHPPASDIAVDRLDEGWVQISLNFKVQRPPRGYLNAVRELEPVRMLFPPSYPLSAPHIWLRSDFSRNLPHINPSWEVVSDHVNPCIVDESLDSFMRHHGFGQVVHRLQIWLDDVAFDTLARDDQYWEPMRRDGLKWYLAARRDDLASLVTDRKKWVVLPAFVDRAPTAKDDFGLFGGILSYQSLSPSVAATSIAEGLFSAIAVVVGSGETVTQEYLPDDVFSLTDLERRAKQYGCPSIRSVLQPFVKGVTKSDFQGNVPVFVVLAVHRPKSLPLLTEGEHSTIELIPYATILEPGEVVGRNGLERHFALPEMVVPFGMRQDVSPQLLRETSGLKIGKDMGRVAVLGCGSLGSKVAMHLGKGGFGELELYDRGRLSPHNLARLGIVSERHVCGVAKAEAVRVELAMLGHHGAKPHEVDVVPALASAEGLLFDDQVQMVFDATANPNVHDALCRGRVTPANARIVQSSFLAGGRIALMAQEGAGREPDLEDIKSAFWRHWAYAPERDHSVWPEVSGLNRLRVGEGCESQTMIMSDTQASMLASGVARITQRSLEEKPRARGRLSFGIVEDDECTVTWHHSDVSKSISVPTEGTWEVRILSELADEIDSQARAANKLETGGWLVGRINWAIRRVTLAAHVPAPPDSIHEAGRFVLGTDGAQVELLRLHERSRKAFCALGTWHSHPAGGSESGTDLKTLENIAAGFCGTPAVSLIWTPKGFRALVRQDWPESTE